MFVWCHGCDLLYEELEPISEYELVFSASRTLYAILELEFSSQKQCMDTVVDTLGVTVALIKQRRFDRV